MNGRSQILGGSDIGALLGVSPWRTRYDLWLEKTGAQESEPSEKRRRVLERGKRLEPVVVEMIREEMGIEIVGRNERCIDAVHPWMQAEIDFCWIDESGAVQNGDVKTVHPLAAKDWGEEGTDEIPLYYCAQFQWGLMMKPERRECLVAALIGADDLRLYRVVRDDEVISSIRETALRFWEENVLGRIPPEPDTAEDAKKMLRRYGGFVSAGTPEAWEAAHRLRRIREAQKRLAEQAEKYELVIEKQLLLEAQGMGQDGERRFIMNGPDGRRVASLNLQHRKGYQVKESDFWVLRVNGGMDNVRVCR